MSGPVILYDGVCGLCDRWVRFVLERDAAGEFRFAPLQGAYARGLLKERAVKLDTVYVAADGRVLSKAKAVLYVLGRIGGVWKIPAAAGVLPAFLLDPFYDLVAGIRYRLFGRFDACPLPDPRWKSRFID